MTELHLNQQTADRINISGGLNGKQYQPGDWLALLDSKVVAVAKNLEDAVGVLRRLEPDSNRGMVFQYGLTAADVIR
jgi:hypothetical protein